MQSMKEEIKNHLQKQLIPFWKKLHDNEWGGYYGYMGMDGKTDKKAVKGCILNSRITWFFSQAYLLLHDETLLEEARHGFEFLKKHCYDKEFGGVYWSLNYDGTPKDDTKHTYNQAFAIYALSSYYEATKDKESLALAEQLYGLIEEKCKDEGGYLEAFTRDFHPQSNEKLSENGVIAERTMNTFLHVFEAYTKLYEVIKKEEAKEEIKEKIKKRMEWMLDLVANKIYNPMRKRQEVFFDKEYHSLIDLHSYGHDIETAWLLDRGLEVIESEKYEEKIRPIIKTLTKEIYNIAFDGHSVSNECERGVVDTDRVWWVQAESVVGFLNGWQKENEQKYYDAAREIWNYIKENIIQDDLGGEWCWLISQEGKIYEEKPLVDEWKCPYHNGRMCIEAAKRLG